MDERKGKKSVSQENNTENAIPNLQLPLIVLKMKLKFSAWMIGRSGLVVAVMIVVKQMMTIFKLLTSNLPVL